MTIALKALDFTQPSRSVVDSARALGDEVCRRVASSPTVVVAFDGLRGVSSSYFNVLFQTIRDTAGTETLRSAVEFRYDSDAQRTIAQRSLRAVLASAA